MAFVAALLAVGVEAIAGYRITIYIRVAAGCLASPHTASFFPLEPLSWMGGYPDPNNDTFTRRTEEKLEFDSHLPGVASFLLSGRKRESTRLQSQIFQTRRTSARCGITDIHARWKSKFEKRRNKNRNTGGKIAGWAGRRRSWT